MLSLLDQNPIACILVPHFLWDTEVARQPPLQDRDGLVIGKSLELTSEQSGEIPQRVVLDHSPGLKGVIPGMPFSEAVSRHKDAVLIEADTPHYETVFEEVLQQLERVVPDVEGAHPGLAYAGIWGLEGLYGNDADVVRVLAEAVRAVADFDLRLGVGENKWLAYMAAMAGCRGSGRKVTSEPGQFLDPFSVDFLLAPYELIQRLHAFGLETMGDVADLQQGAVEAQFGPLGGVVWKLANGVDEKPLVPRKTVEAVTEYLDFPDATVDMTTIVWAVESLLSTAFSRPQIARRYARKADLHARVFRRPPWTIHVAFKEPTSSKNGALFAIKAKLDTVKIPGPLEDMRLTLSGLTGESWRQESMWKELQREGQLQQAMSQLRARLGVAPPIYQVRELEPWSRIPERRHALVQLSP